MGSSRVSIKKEATSPKRRTSTPKSKRSNEQLGKRKRNAQTRAEDGVVILSDTEEDDVIVPSVQKKHKCSLCGHPVADFDDLQVEKWDHSCPLNFRIVSSGC